MVSIGISVIVPCYNQGHLLWDAIACLREQTFKEWECIIVDDGSLDVTHEVAKAACNADPRFSYIFQPNSGLSAARNTGLAKAKGTYIQFLDADDVIQPGKLSAHSGFLRQHPEVDIVYGGASFFHSENPSDLLHAKEGKGAPTFPTPSGVKEAILCDMIRRNFLVVSAPLVRRTVFEEIGFFRCDLPSHEDWEMWLRCAVSGKVFAFADEGDSATLIRLTESSMSTKLEKMYLTELQIRRELDALILTPELKLINSSETSLVKANLGALYLKKGQVFLGSRLIGQAFSDFRNFGKITFQTTLRLLPPTIAGKIRYGPVMGWLRARLRQS